LTARHWHPPVKAGWEVVVMFDIDFGICRIVNYEGWNLINKRKIRLLHQLYNLNQLSNSSIWKQSFLARSGAARSCSSRPTSPRHKSSSQSNRQTSSKMPAEAGPKQDKAANAAQARQVIDLFHEISTLLVCPLSAIEVHG
jgi:hypothetical protein